MPHPLINQLNILKVRNAKLRDIINKLQQDKDSTIKQKEQENVNLHMLLQQKEQENVNLHMLLQQKEQEIFTLKNLLENNVSFNKKTQITDELDKQNIKYTHIGDFIIYE